MLNFDFFATCLTIGFGGCIISSSLFSLATFYVLLLFLSCSWSLSSPPTTAILYSISFGFVGILIKIVVMAGYVGLYLGNGGKLSSSSSSFWMTGNDIVFYSYSIFWYILAFLVFSHATTWNSALGVSLGVDELGSSLCTIFDFVTSPFFPMFLNKDFNKDSQKRVCNTPILSEGTDKIVVL